MKGTTAAHLALLAANLIYGINYTVAKIALPAFIKPYGFILIRVGVATCLYWILHAFLSNEKVEKKDYPLLIMCGIFGIAINQLLFFKGLAITTEINASLIMIMVPVMVLLLSWLILKERITTYKIIGIILGASGTFLLIAFGHKYAFGSATSLGDLYIFINAASYSLYLVIVKPLMRKYHPLTIVKWVFTFGLPFIFVLGWPQLQEVQWHTFHSGVWFSVFYVVIGTTFFAYALNIFALSKVNPSMVSIYIYMQPVIATIVAIAIGSDELTAIKLLAAGCIFAGVYLVSNVKINKQKA